MNNVRATMVLKDINIRSHTTSHLNLERVNLSKVYSAHALGYAYHHKIFNLCIIARVECVIH